MAVSEAGGRWWLRSLDVEALGDDFAQLSGQWMEGARLASHLRGARAVWAYAALREDDIAHAAEAARISAGERLIGLVPGAQPGWDAEGAQALRALLPDAPEGAAVGLLLAVKAPDCANCPGKCGTNGGCSALYPYEDGAMQGAGYSDVAKQNDNAKEGTTPA